MNGPGQAVNNQQAVITSGNFQELGALYFKVVTCDCHCEIKDDLYCNGVYSTVYCLLLQLKETLYQVIFVSHVWCMANGLVYFPDIS